MSHYGIGKVGVGLNERSDGMVNVTSLASRPIVGSNASLEVFTTSPQGTSPSQPPSLSANHVTLANSSYLLFHFILHVH